MQMSRRYHRSSHLPIDVEGMCTWIMGPIVRLVEWIVTNVYLCVSGCAWCILKCICGPERVNHIVSMYGSPTGKPAAYSEMESSETPDTDTPERIDVRA